MNNKGHLPIEGMLYKLLVCYRVADASLLVELITLFYESLFFWGCIIVPSFHSLCYLGKLLHIYSVGSYNASQLVCV